MPSVTTQNKVFNRSIWIDEEGEIASYYDKLHLFDYGALKESNTVEAGTQIVKPVESCVGRVGMMICFDVSYFLYSIFHFPYFYICLFVCLEDGICDEGVLAVGIKSARTCPSTSAVLS